MKIMRWSEKETCAFVKHYLRHPNLWNPHHDDYKCKIKKDEAYADIIKSFHRATGMILSVREVQMKIRNLRSTYCQELIKIKTRSRPGAYYVPTIRWFSEWHKIFRRLTKKNRYSPDEPGTEQSEEYNNSEILQSEEYNNSEILHIVTLDECNNDNSSDPCAPHSNDEIMAKSELKDPFETHTEVSGNSEGSLQWDRKHVKLSNRSQSIDGSDRKYQYSSELSNNCLEDEFEIYGKYIATQLRSMDLQKAIAVQLQIQGIVTKARLASLAEK